MFNKIKTGMFGESKTEALINMGFSSTQAHEALSATNGDVNRAAELLLSNVTVSSSMQPQDQPQQQQGGAQTDGEDEELRRAMEESVRIMPNDSNRSRTAASIRAGQAAAQRAEKSSSRFGNKTAKSKKNVKKPSTTSKQPAVPTETHPTIKSTNTPALSIQHPKVKIPTQMKDKTKEEQILRCTKRLSPHPLAVDTLILSLTAIRANPSDSKYRKIDRNNTGYKRALHEVPGALDLLLAVNFRQRSVSNELIMHAADVDYALLYLAISALEKIREDSEEYRNAKRLRRFREEVRRIQTGRDITGEEENEEAIRRAAYISKCPTEPLTGAGALLQLTIADEIKLQRRFDGDDTLRDVVHWVAGGCGSIIPEKLTTREWCLVDLNRYPIIPMDVEGNMDRTLQFLGCWPSGKLEIQPSSDAWRDKNLQLKDEKMGSSRGLGAAPSSALG